MRNTFSFFLLGLALALFSSSGSHGALVPDFVETFSSGGANDAANYTPIDGHGVAVQTFLAGSSFSDGNLLDSASDGYARLHRTATVSETIGMTRELGTILASNVGEVISLDAAFAVPNSAVTVTWEIEINSSGVGGQGKMIVNTFGSGNASSGNSPLLLSTISLGSINPQRTTTGPLTYTIQASDVGKSARLKFSYFDSSNNGSGEGVRNLNVDAVSFTGPPVVPNDPPVFNANPVISSDATEFVPYHGSIASSATDPDGDLLVFSKVSGPGWLNVLSDGSLGGAPDGGSIGPNSFTVQADDRNGGTSTTTLEINVVAGSSVAVLEEGFDSGSGAVGSINGWSEGGPETKEYNVGGSGELVILDDNGDEKGNGPHAGFFDNLTKSLASPLSLNSLGEVIELSLDFDVFSGSYSGASVANDAAGLRISLTEAGVSGDAGYGIYIATGTQTTHSYREMQSGASAQATIGNALTGVDLSENAALKNLTLILKRTAAGVELSGMLDGNPLATFTNNNTALFDNVYNTLTLSVASRDHGLRVDNLTIEKSSNANLWNQYVAARASGTEPLLPDFSYVGYRHGDEPIPTVDWTIFDVTNYGAIADDDLSDKAAINAAISAAEANGSGIIFFPPGRFDINTPTTPWTNDPIYVEGSHIVFRGSGSGAGGTELYAERYMDPTDPAKLWSSPKNIYFRGNGDIPGTSSAVVADSARETFSVTVANAAIFGEGDWVQLTRQDNSPAAVAEAVAPYAVDPAWTNLINDGVRVEEFHLITAIDGNVITFKEPVHSAVTSTGNWSVVLFDPLVEVGVEDIAFVGNWTDNFVHHASFLDDSGWGALQFTAVANSWIRHCRFTNWSTNITVSTSATVSVSNILLNGNKGHNALTFNNSSHCLASFVEDVANHHHACGVAGMCSGNVFWNSEYSDDTCYEAHASQPRSTLFDRMTGGWKYGRWGGAIGSQPNHLRGLVFWNYENIGTGEPGLFEFMRSSSAFGKIIMPYVVGFHGNPQAFDETQVAALESNGAIVEPLSLYEAQYKLRRGKQFTNLLYQEWAEGYGLSGSAALVDANPDFDPWGNLLEYAMGGDPASSISEGLEPYISQMTETAGDAELDFVYLRRRNADDLGLRYQVEKSTTLDGSSWSTGGQTLIDVTMINDSFESVTVRMTFPGDEPGFVRLRVTLEE